MRLALQGMHRILEMLFDLLDARQQALALVDVERREAGRAGGRMRRVRIAVEQLDRVVRTCHQRVVHGGGAQAVDRYPREAPLGAEPGALQALGLEAGVEEVLPLVVVMVRVRPEQELERPRELGIEAHLAEEPLVMQLLGK